jgi:hypothetical protein
LKLNLKTANKYILFFGRESVEPGYETGMRIPSPTRTEEGDPDNRTFVSYFSL